MQKVFRLFISRSEKRKLIIQWLWKQQVELIQKKKPIKGTAKGEALVSFKALVEHTPQSVQDAVIDKWMRYCK